MRGCSGGPGGGIMGAGCRWRKLCRARIANRDNTALLLKRTPTRRIDAPVVGTLNGALKAITALTSCPVTSIANLSKRHPSQIVDPPAPYQMVNMASAPHLLAWCPADTSTALHPFPLPHTSC